jgi:hypothetical protein
VSPGGSNVLFKQADDHSAGGVNERADERTDERMDECADDHAHEPTDEHTDERAHERTDEHTDKRTDKANAFNIPGERVVDPFTTRMSNLHNMYYIYTHNFNCP